MPSPLTRIPHEDDLTNAAAPVGDGVLYRKGGGGVAYREGGIEILITGGSGITFSTVTNEANRLALSDNPGQFAHQLDTGHVYQQVTSPPSVDGNWKNLTAASGTDLAWVGSTSTVTSSTGTDASLTVVSGSQPGLMTSALLVDLQTLNNTTVPNLDQATLRVDGSKPLTNDWDAGSYEIRAQQLHADITTGTPPLVIASTTVVANLNADLIDGIQAAEFIQRNGSVDFTANQSLGGNRITNLGAPSAQSDAARLQDVAGGNAWKDPVRVATTSAGTLATSFENGDTVDGVLLSTGDRILIKNQSSGVENGIYTVEASGAPTRATDLPAAAEAKGVAMYCTEGSINADVQFVCTNDTGSDVVGTDSLNFAVYGVGGGGGEVNTASNVGAGGVGVFKQKTGVNIEFRTINAASSKITVSLDAANNEVDVDLGSVALSDLSDVTGTTGTGNIVLHNGPTLKLITIEDAGDHFYHLTTEALLADRNIHLPALTSNDVFVFEDHVATLTNKTFVLGDNLLDGSKADFNDALNDGNFAFNDATLISGQASASVQTGDEAIVNRSGSLRRVLVDDMVNPSPPPPEIYATKQVDFDPGSPSGAGAWTYVEDVEFQDGLTFTTARDKIVFRNCKFGGTCSFDSLTNARFIDCTVSSVTGTALTFTNSSNLEIENLIATTVTEECLRLDTCENVLVRRAEITAATSTAPRMTITTNRSAIFESTSNLSSPNVVYAAIHVLSCTTVRIEKPRLVNCPRTGIFCKLSSDVIVTDVDIEDGHEYDDTGTSMNDDPIMIMDCTNWRVSGGQIMNTGRHGVYVHETPPSTPAGGLGLLLNNGIVEKLRIRMNPVDDRSDTSGSYGIFVQGGSDITVQDNDVSNCGESGIEFGTFGTDRAKVFRNNSHHNGQNTGKIHFDGFSFQSGHSLLVQGNSFHNNYRSGLQLKPGFLQTGGFHNEYPCTDVTIKENTIHDNGRGAEGYGIQLLDSGSGSNRQACDRILIQSNVIFDNDRGNLLITTGGGTTYLYDNLFGECDATSNVKWQDSFRVVMRGGCVHGQAVTGQNFLVRASDNVGASGLSDIFDVDFQGVDVSALNRRNLALAVAATADPDTDTLAVALAAAGVFIYDYLGASTGGSSTVRDVSEIPDADRADVAILTDGDSPICPNRNHTDLLVSTGHAIQCADKYSIQPVQKLLSVNAGGTGPGWVAADLIYAINGFEDVFGTSGDDAADLNKIELMLLSGWGWRNVLPATGDHPGGLAIADDSIEAEAPLETAPT